MKAAVIRWVKRKTILPNNEIFELAEAAGYDVIYDSTFYGNRPHSKQFIPHKHLDMLIDVIQTKEINKLIIEGYIKTKQIMELEKIIEIEIIDKPLLVLEIFHLKANSKEIQLQIDLAELIYKIPRMVSAVGESVQSEKESYGGSGEQATELLLSDVRNRRARMERKLSEIKELYLRNVEGDGIPRLPIIGFYSVGKSSLFNLFTDNDQEVDPKAFTTMLLKTGRSDFLGYPLDLIDTIGIVDLPKDILNSFDLMLTKIFSFPGIMLCLDTSVPLRYWEEMLEDLRINFEKFNKALFPKLIIALTKIDLIDEATLTKIKAMLSNEAWLITYKVMECDINKPENIIKQFTTAFEELFSDRLSTFSFPNLHPKFASRLHEVARITDQSWNNDGTTAISGIGIKEKISPLIGEFNK